MVHRQGSDHLHFAVIGKTSTHIWGAESATHNGAVTVHDPRSRPHFGSISSSQTTSNYDTHDLKQSSHTKFGFIPAWIRPSLDDRYCELIYKRLKDCDHAFIVGGGVGRWSGVNNFVSYIEENHKEFAERVEYRVHFRLSDYPELKLRKIFSEMSREELA